MGLLVVKHESHLIATSVDSRNAESEGSDQVVERSVEHIGQYGALQVAPQPLDEVQARAVRRQPVNPDLGAVMFEPLTYSLRVMESAVVANQANPSAPISPQERDQEYEEVRS